MLLPNRECEKKICEENFRFSPDFFTKNKKFSFKKLKNKTNTFTNNE